MLFQQVVSIASVLHADAALVGGWNVTFLFGLIDTGFPDAPAIEYELRVDKEAEPSNG